MSPLLLATGRLYSIYRVQRGLLQSWIGSRRPQALWLDWTSASNDSQLFSTVSSLSTLFGAGSQAPGCARFYPPQPCIVYVTTAQSWQLDRLLLKTLIITFAQFMLAPNAKICSFQRKVKLFVISLCPLQSMLSNFSINILNWSNILDHFHHQIQSKRSLLLPCSLCCMYAWLSVVFYRTTIKY